MHNVKLGSDLLIADLLLELSVSSCLNANYYLVQSSQQLNCIIFRF